jgi:hypothetical protein
MADIFLSYQLGDKTPLVMFYLLFLTIEFIFEIAEDRFKS